MPLGLPIFLAYGDSSAWNVLVWIVAGLIGILAQINAAKKKHARQARHASSAPSGPAAAPGGGESPTAGELAEIFRRLGADIPGTPPPASKPAAAQAPVRSAPPPRPVTRTTPPSRPASRAAPPLRPSPAGLKKPATTSQGQMAARKSPRPMPPPARPAAPAAARPGVESRQDEHRALDVSTRHTGMILPRMYAMGLRLTPWPWLPMPGLDRSRHARHPLRARLHAPREIRDALVVQNYLRPPKSLSP